MLIHFWFTKDATQFKPKEYSNINMSLSIPAYKLIATSSSIPLNTKQKHMFLFYFYSCLCILNVGKCRSNVAHIFCIIVHVFRKLFWKICRLFGKILITSLKCFRVFFTFLSQRKDALGTRLSKSYDFFAHWGLQW